MTTVVQLQASGIKELVAVLAGLPPEIIKKVNATAMRKAMTPVWQAARANAAVSVKSGSLLAAIGTRTATADRMNVASMKYRLATLTGYSRADTAVVGSVLPIRKDSKAISLYNFYYHRKNKSNTIRHGHFVEWGRRGAYTRHPFLGPALVAHAQDVVDILTNEYRKGIERYLASNAKSGGSGL